MDEIAKESVSSISDSILLSYQLVYVSLSDDMMSLSTVSGVRTRSGKTANASCLGKGDENVFVIPSRQFVLPAGTTTKLGRLPLIVDGEGCMVDCFDVFYGVETRYSCKGIEQQKFCSLKRGML